MMSPLGFQIKIQPPVILRYDLLTPRDSNHELLLVEVVRLGGGLRSLNAV